jgi:hypothetical protein
MRTLVTIVTPPAQTALTTVATVKAELGTQTASALLRLPALIEQASGLITGYLGRELARATIQETIIWGADFGIAQQQLVVSRPPVATLTSVSFDGVLQDLSTIDFDQASGLMYRHAYAYNLDYNINPGYGYGYRTDVVYDGGYLLPGQSNRDLPYAIERACIDITLALWHRSARGDPMIRSESVDGIGSTQYLDPMPGNAGGMPPTAVAALTPFCNYGV